MKKHIKKFEGFRTSNIKNEELNETVYQVEQDGATIYRVNIVVDVPAKMVSAYAKKVKQNCNKELTDIMANNMVAEELVRYVVKVGLDPELIPATALIGGGQTQGQAQVQTQVQPQTQGQAQVQVQPDAAQIQPQSQEEFVDIKNDEDLPI